MDWNEVRCGDLCEDMLGVSAIQVIRSKQKGCPEGLKERRTPGTGLY